MTTEPLIQLSDSGDDSAKVTVSVDDEDHRFNVFAVGSMGVISYEETLSWRGQIRTRVPDEEVWRTAMQSDEVTAFLEARGLDKLRRERAYQSNREY